MHSQRVNRYTRSITRANPSHFKRAQVVNNRPIHDVQTGFIQHPAGFPIEVKRKRFWEKLQCDDLQYSRIGIMFDSDEYFKPGIYIQISIPLPNKTEVFTGKVVLVRQSGESYEIGLSLFNQEDASRARIVEQICHIERYMQEKKYRDGPYNLNPERVASEWISKYASEVPSL